ncbi:transcriptional regulator, MucR family [Desulfacinum hydrothermale DSM 13146]|uniref:Transcriptional regulator, MucR family n=1 Tax=Desulfacinum hydrothermale DSM 13146 TaxID=1121390 RepID=A0A1W1WYW1_9BACT|nr:MucR family transcriptional regulator [Desulfacinum hydrothermale]SMC16628.1 transcriptional regulator, MucR family [Desulfacinum hydrothermale DSM 13146]
MAKKILEMCVQIVTAQASAAVMSTEEIEEALKKTFQTLQELQTREESQEAPVSEWPSDEAKEPAARAAMDPKSSIGENSVVCLECGAEFRQITANHLRSHGLTPREYKKKWGFRLKDSLAAKVLTRSRSAAAKKRGIPDKLREYHEARRKQKK